MKKLLAMLLCIVSTASVAQSSTTVCGTVYGTWTKAQSPYLVTCDVLVSGLTIEPGVKVLFLGPYSFQVAGTLTAVGTASDSIVFGCPDSVASWRGIFFNYSSPSTLAYCDISRSTNRGITIDSSRVDIHDCMIRNNSAQVAGGGVWTNSPLTLRHCTIKSNSVSDPSFAGGGGVCSNNALIILDSVIRNNTAACSASFGGMTAVGGGIYCSGTATLHIFDSLVRANRVTAYCSFVQTSPATAAGGGIGADGQTLVERCRIDSNYVHAEGIQYGCGTTLGGGVYSSAQFDLNNSILSDNPLSGDICGATSGGGMYVAQGQATLRNCTLAYNAVSGLEASVSTVMVLNSIVFFNDTQIGTGGLSVYYSDVQGGYGAAADSNFSANPIFASRTSMKIFPGSPCIDRGAPATHYNDACFSPCGDPNDPVCMLPSYGTARNDVGAGGGPGACPSTIPDVVAPVVHVLSPNGGETLTNGTNFPLSWSATDNVGVQSVDLKLSRTGPTGPWETLASGIANRDTCIWLVSGAAANNSAYLRVVARDYAGNADSAMSASAFTTPTLVELFRAVPTDAGMRVEWELSDPSAFQSLGLERAASASGGWSPVAATPVTSGRTTSVLDADATAGQEQWYRLSGVRRDGSSSTFGPISATAQEPITAFALSPLSPNPTRGHALLTFEIPVRTYVRLTLVDVQGRKAAMLADGVREPGRYAAALEAGDLRAGIYFVRMQAKGVDLTRRVVVVR